MKSSESKNIAEKEIYELLRSVIEEISKLSEKIEGISSRLDTLSGQIIPEKKSELGGHLQETVEAMSKLDSENNGLPISRTDLAKELDIHPNTAYIRAEKLVQKKMIIKYYGRELGKDRFEEKKAVFYSIFNTLYNRTFLEELENNNKSAYLIAVTLLQHQPLTETELLETSKSDELEIRSGIKYLLNRGLIIKELKNNVIQYRIRKIEFQDEETTSNSIE